MEQGWAGTNAGSKTCIGTTFWAIASNPNTSWMTPKHGRNFECPFILYDNLSFCMTTPFIMYDDLFCQCEHRNCTTQKLSQKEKSQQKTFSLVGIKVGTGIACLSQKVSILPLPEHPTPLNLFLVSARCMIGGTMGPSRRSYVSWVGTKTETWAQYKRPNQIPNGYKMRERLKARDSLL